MSNEFRDQRLPLLDELPQTFEGELTVSQVRAYLKQGYLLVDARPVTAYQASHIEGAVSRSHQIDATDRVIVYCSDRRCPRAEVFAKELKRYGLEEVLVMPDGLVGWRDRGYPVVRGADR